MVSPRLTPRIVLRGTAELLVAAAIIALLAIDTSWRLAVLAGLVAGAIGLTRLRYSPLVAIALLLVVLALAQTNRTAGSDDRPVPTRASQR